MICYPITWKQKDAKRHGVEVFGSKSSIRDKTPGKTTLTPLSSPPQRELPYIIHVPLSTVKGEADPTRTERSDTSNPPEKRKP